MTGRDRARRIMGLGQPQLPKRYDFPETTEELQRLTGAVWRPLGFQARAAQAYWAYDMDDPESDGVWYAGGDTLNLPDPLWEQAWVTRHDGWLMVYHSFVVNDEQVRTAYIDYLTHPELDRASVERIAKHWWRLVGVPWEPLPIETDSSELRYLLQFGEPHRDANVFDGLLSALTVFLEREAHPQFLPASLRLMRAIVERLREVS